MKLERRSAGKTSQGEESSETETPDKQECLKIQSEHSSDVVRSAEMSDPILRTEFVTNMSVIPCRLNADLHEWHNEIVTVPN